MSFITPGGKPYHIGEEYEAHTDKGEILFIVHIEAVTEGTVIYSLPEAPDTAPIHLPRTNFEQLMDEGRLLPVQIIQTPELEMATRLHAFFRLCSLSQF